MVCVRAAFVQQEVRQRLHLVICRADADDLASLAHLMNQLAEWCSNADPVDYACVGPWLFFNDDDFFKVLSHFC